MRKITRRSFLAASAALAATGALTACGGSSSSVSTASSAAASSEAASSAASPAPEETSAHEVNTTDDITLTISWWGGESRHMAYQEAVAAFEKKYPNITVNTDYGAWSGWAEKQSTALSAGTASDVMQVAAIWLYQYSPTAQSFVDLREYSDVLDLTNWTDAELDACIIGGSLQAVPIAMTGRIFYWNMNTFKQAGLETYPSTLEELLAAGQTFQEKLGEDYYPVALGAYDRMLVMTLYLQSKYGKPIIVDGVVNFTQEEFVDGLEFIKSLEDNHVTPTIAKMRGAGFDTIDKSDQWINGQYAGIWEWDSAAAKYHDALADNSGFTVGDEIKYGDAANGGFSKVSMAMAIAASCEHPVEAAALINFLLNEEEGASIMGTNCGLVASDAGLAAAEKAGAVDPLVKEANGKVMAFADTSFYPYYESSILTDEVTGVYTDAFEGYSYGDYTAEEAAQVLIDGMTEVMQAG